MVDAAALPISVEALEQIIELTNWTACTSDDRRVQARTRIGRRTVKAIVVTDQAAGTMG